MSFKYSAYEERLRKGKIDNGESVIALQRGVCASIVVDALCPEDTAERRYGDRYRQRPAEKPVFYGRSPFALRFSAANL